MTAIALTFAGRRAAYLYRLITSGQPAPDRIEGVTGRLGRAVKTQLVEVFGQRKLLKWSIPGAAHFFVFWARSEEHTSELQSQSNLVCRLLLEKKKKNTL